MTDKKKKIDKSLEKVSGGYGNLGFEEYEYYENCPQCKAVGKLHVKILDQIVKRSTDKECEECGYRVVDTIYRDSDLLKYYK